MKFTVQHKHIYLGGASVVTSLAFSPFLVCLVWCTQKLEKYAINLSQTIATIQCTRFRQSTHLSIPLPLLNHCISSKLTTNNVYALHIIPSFIAAFCQWKGNPCMALIKNPSFSSSWRLTSTTHTLIFFPCFRRPAAWPQLQDVLAISFSASLPGLTRTRRSELVPP